MVAFLTNYVTTIVFSWWGLFGGLTLVLELAEKWLHKPLPVPLNRRGRSLLLVALVMLAQGHEYKKKSDELEAMRSRLAIRNKLSDLLAEGDRLRAQYRKEWASNQWWSDPKPAIDWDAKVCAYLEENVERSYCTRFRAGVRPLPTDDSERAEWMVELVEQRIAKVDTFLKELSEH